MELAAARRRDDSIGAMVPLLRSAFSRLMSGRMEAATSTERAIAVGFSAAVPKKQMHQKGKGPSAASLRTLGPLPERRKGFEPSTPSLGSSCSTS